MSESDQRHSVLLPVWQMDAGEPQGEIEYLLARCPFPSPWAIEGFDVAEGDAYVAWLTAVEAERRQLALECLRRCGAPVSRLPRDPVELTDLANWLKEWLPEVFRPYWGSYWSTAPGRLHHNFVPEGRPGHSDVGQATRQSLVHDVAFIVLGCVDLERPEAAWRRLVTQPIHRQVPPLFYAVIGDDEPRVAPVEEVGRLFSAALDGLSPNDEEQRDNRWAERNLGDQLFGLYRRLAGIDRPDPHRWTEFGKLPDDIYDAMLARYGWTRESLAAAQAGRLENVQVPKLPILRLRKPGRRTPAAPDVVRRAVEQYRGAGFFAAYREWSLDDLARAIAARPEMRSLGPEPRDGPQLDVVLLQLDGERSLVDDVEAGFSRGELGYVGLLRGLAARSGQAFSVTRGRESWRDDGSVEVSWRSGAHRQLLVLADCGDVVDPDLVPKLNAFLPAGGPHFYIVDNGGQEMIIVRATAEEREQLQRLRPVELLLEAPDWWREGAGPVGTTPS